MAWGWLKKKLEGAVAQVNPFDNGRTYDTVVNQKQPGYRQREAGQPAKPSYGGGFAGLINRARDVVDANTPQDRFIRQQLGQPLNYYDQQKQLGLKPISNPVLQVANQFTKPVTQFVNTGNLAAREVADTARMYAAQATNNPEAFRNANQAAKADYQRFGKQDSGLFGQGTFFKNPEEAQKGEFSTTAKRIGGGTLETAATVVPFAKGATLVKPGVGLVRNIPRLAAEGGIYGGTFSAGGQLVDKGYIDPIQLAKDTAIGATLGVAGGVTTKAARERAPLNEVGAIGKNVDPLESLKQEARTVEKFGWKSEATPQGTKLINRDGKHVATITEKKGRYTASYNDGRRIATGTDANKLAEDVARKTFYAQELPETQNTGGTLRPDKTPEPFKNTVRQGEISPERAKKTQANVDSMKASMEFDKTPTPKKAFHSTASLEIEGGKLRASSDGVMGEGVYLHTDPNTARYAGAMQGDGNIADQQALDINLKTDNLYKWADQNYPTAEQLALIKKRGYDGVYKQGGEIVVFDPNKIELSKATNLKTKSTAEPNTVDLDSNILPQKATQSQPPKTVEQDAKAEMDKFYGKGGDQEFMAGLIKKYESKLDGKKTIEQMLNPQEKARYEQIKSGSKSPQVSKTDKGLILQETKPQPDGSKIIRRRVKDAKGNVQVVEQRVDKNTDRVKIENKDPYIKEYAAMLQDQEKGRKGGQLVDDGEGGKKRITEHDTFYRNYFKQYGRKPTRDDYYLEAQRQVRNGTADPAFMEYYNEVNKQRVSDQQRVLENKPPKKLSDAEWQSLLDQAQNEGVQPTKKTLLKIRAERNQDIKEAVQAGDLETANRLREDGRDISQKIRIQTNENKPLTITETPTKQLETKSLKDAKTKQAFEAISKQYLGETKSAKIDRDATIVDLNKNHKLSKNEQLNAIQVIDDATVAPISKKVENYVKDFRTLTDTAYQDYTSKGVNMGYVDFYLPRIYKNPETGQLLTGQEYRLLQQGSSRQKGRTAELLNEDALIYKNPTQLLESYYKSLDESVAGNKYMQELEKQGIIIASNEPVPGLRPVVAEGIRQPEGLTYYANKDVANKLNTMFGNKEATNLVEKIAEKAQGINSFMQSFVLSGGVPNTPINAFGIMQVMKEGMAGHPIKAGKAFYAGMNKKFASDVFNKKKDILKLMAENDIDPRVDLQEQSKTGIVRIKESNKKFNQAWNEFTNDATFRRFMPMLEVMHFENVLKTRIRRGDSPELAVKRAADSVKNFYGKTSDYKQSTRAKLTNDTAGAVLFAPRFRESMVNFWGKNIKALGNPTKPEYRDNIKFLVSSAVVYAAMEGLNKALNDAWMHDNPDGKKDKLIIPADKLPFDNNGKDIAIPFLSSIATIPRNAIQGGFNLATGRFKEAGKNAKTALSMPLNLAGDIITNENYFGQPIVEEGSTPGQRFGQVASYAVKGNMQPWIREGVNLLGKNLPEDTKKALGIKDKGVFETISNAIESPIRFYDSKYYRYNDSWTPRGGKNQSFTIAEQRDRATLKKQKDSIVDRLGLSNTQKKKYEAINSFDFDDDGNLITDNNPFYQSQKATALQDDGVFEAMKQRNILDKKINGKPVDPLYGLNGEARRLVLWKMTLPQGTEDPSIKEMYGQEWYQNYRAEQDKYYRAKNAWNNKMGYKNKFADSNPYPEPNKQLQSKLDQYYKLPYGTGARSSFINQNPDLLAHWDRVESWKNGERALVGLGPLEDKDSYYSGGNSYSRRGRRKSGGGRKGSKGVKIAVSTAFAPSTPKAMKLSSKKAPAVTLKVPKVNVAKSRKTPIKLAKKAKTIKSVKV